MEKTLQGSLSLCLMSSLIFSLLQNLSISSNFLSQFPSIFSEWRVCPLPLPRFLLLSPTVSFGTWGIKHPLTPSYHQSLLLDQRISQGLLTANRPTTHIPLYDSINNEIPLLTLNKNSLYPSTPFSHWNSFFLPPMILILFLAHYRNCSSSGVFSVFNLLATFIPLNTFMKLYFFWYFSIVSVVAYLALLFSFYLNTDIHQSSELLSSKDSTCAPLRYCFQIFKFYASHLFFYGLCPDLLPEFKSSLHSWIYHLQVQPACQTQYCP